MTMETEGSCAGARSRVTRRRTLSLLAATAGLALAGPAAAKTPAPTRWQGSVLGARAQMLIHGLDERRAQRLIDIALAEVRRLERIFSLYQAESALVRLNRDGRLDHPPLELVALLDRARFWSAWSGGAFDVTVQPLWALYRDHFATSRASPAGPPLRAIEATRRLVDYRAIEIERDRVAFARPGMAVTLNGIAQGYITDRVAKLLRGEGLEQVLIDLGEIWALGSAPGNLPWRVGLVEPSQAGRTLEIIDRAVATSAPAGTLFDQSGRFHHLIDPATGRSSRGLRSVTVVARHATDADALSTALIVGGRDCGALNETPGTIEQILMDGVEIHTPLIYDGSP
jgi:thiamine biosynthesis lipoprotein